MDRICMVGALASSSKRARTAAQDVEVAAMLETSLPFAALPRELLSLSFSFLDVADRARMRLVCRSWNAAALEAPNSTSLSIGVLLEPYDESWRFRIYKGPEGLLEPSEVAAVLRQRLNVHVLFPSEATSLFKRPLCSAVEELTLVLVDPWVTCMSPAAVRSLGAVGSALSMLTQLRSLRLDYWHGAPPQRVGWPNSPLHSGLPLLLNSCNNPKLEEIGPLEDGETFSFTDLGRALFAHPGLKYVHGSIDTGANWFHDKRALMCLPRLERVSTIYDTTWKFNRPAIAALAEAKVSTDHLVIWGSFHDPAIVEAHRLLLRVGSTLDLRELRSFRSLTSGAFQVPVSRLEIMDCKVPLADLEHLLCKIETYAPQLKDLHIDRSTVKSSTSPREIIAILKRASKGTNISVDWPLPSNYDEWSPNPPWAGAGEGFELEIMYANPGSSVRLLDGGQRLRTHWDVVSWPELGIP